MKHCLLCPKDKRCRGVAMSQLLVRLEEEKAGTGSFEAALRRIGRADLSLFEGFGAKNRETCWNKAYILAVTRLVVRAMVTAWREEGALDDPEVIAETHRRIEDLHGLYRGLPGGIRINLTEAGREIATLAFTETVVELVKGILTEEDDASVDMRALAVRMTGSIDAFLRRLGGLREPDVVKIGQIVHNALGAMPGVRFDAISGVVDAIVGLRHRSPDQAMAG